MVIQDWYGEIVRIEALFKFFWHNNYSWFKKNSMTNKANPITKKEEVDQSPDNKIDEDFKGYPHGNAKKEIIKPETEEEKKVADIDNKDGEKIIYKKKKGSK